MKPVSTEAPPEGRHNPYQGPREFRRGDQLPNRQREARELTDRVIAERVVLLHSPSGAGKTSLTEAAVVDMLGNEGFVPTPRLRVNQPVDTRGTANPYVHSLVTYLLATPNSPEPPGDMTLREAVAQWRAREQADDNLLTVLIIDQLEEILVIDPTDWGAKEGFFRELGTLLRTEPVWALLSMREDYMGGLDRYLRFLPGFLRSRYRLDFLNRDEAKLAMTTPARDQHVDFREEAAEALVERLTVVEIQKPGEAPRTTTAPYVEPFQLQVVCRQLWKKIRTHRGDDFLTIEVDDVERYADVDQALTLYFGDTVASVVARTGADERKIRDWFESDLITKYNLRGQTLRGPDTSNADRILVLLEEGYLVRGNVRGLSTWYELAHDRLIRAVQSSNERWRWNTLDPWQIAAYEWNASDRHPAFLLRVEEPPKVLPHSKLTDVEKDFIRALENEEGDDWATVPFLRLQLTYTDVDAIRQLDAVEGGRAVREAARVKDIDGEAKRLFGLGRVDRLAPFTRLVEAWQQGRPDASTSWIDELAEQIRVGSHWRLPRFGWQLMNSVDNADRAKYAPILSRIRSVPRQRCHHFDVYFSKFDTDDEGAIKIGFVNQPQAAPRGDPGRPAS
jgi:hypothetical protein